MTTTQDLIAQLRTDQAMDGTTLGNEAADTLEALQAELDEWRFTNKIDELQRLNEELQRTCDSRGKMLLIAGLYPTCTTEDAKTHLAERDAALARLAELEKQEPVIYQAKTKPGFLSTSAYAWEDCEKADFLVYEADGVHVRGLYAAAGASPVEPSQARKLVNTQRVCFIHGWDARGMFNGPESSEEHDMRMRELLDAYYPRAAINQGGQQ